MKDTKKKSLLLIALLLLVGLTSGYVASTYAKYTVEINGNEGTATVAKWAFDVDNASQELAINLANTYDGSTLVDGKIAPGTAGSFNIALSNKNSEVGVDFTIEFDDMENVPTNMKFYKDSGYTNEIVPGEDTITGQLVALEDNFSGVPIYWRWEYETADADVADTTDGKAANTLTIGVTITGTQTSPSETAITSHID